MTHRYLFVLLLAAGLLGVAHAGNTGKIAGVIKDAQTGETLVGVNVVIDGTTMGAATNIDGQYFILNIPPGKYTLVASAVGYNKKTVSNVSVSIDLTTTIDFQISSQVVQSEEVTVTAERPLVQKDLTATTAVVSSEQISALPVTEVGQVLQLQAGFVDGSLRGGRSGEVAYWIDGVPVTDGYDGGQVVEVNKNLVQELQLVSGAFNAEYGQAMSGIVNIATKEGGPKYTGGLGLYAGQYLTTMSDSLFPGLNKFQPTAIRNIEANLSGPILGEDLTFFINGRYIYFDGWLKGYRRFNPWNISYTDPITRQFVLNRDASGLGDSAVVPMNWSKRYYGQGKLTWKISPVLKLNANFIYDWRESKSYDQNTDRRAYFFNPDGYGTNLERSNTLIVQFSHTLSASTFYTVGLSWFDHRFRYRLYDLQYQPATDGSGDLIEKWDPSGPHYVNAMLFQTDDAYSFYTGGTDLNTNQRSTITKVAKLDLSSQIDNYNLVKVGGEYRVHNIFYENIDLQPITAQSAIDLTRDSPFIQTRILPLSSLSHSMYNRSPQEISAYIQDKLEFKDFILNIGLRFDYFDPHGYVLNDGHPDPNDPLHYTYTVDDPNVYSPIKPDNIARTLEERLVYWYRPTKAKYKVSPRIGGSFPITAEGVVHFSYGHFFQVPRFDQLYLNSEFKLPSGTGNLGVVGNADLEPEQTINGEIGVQQQLTEDLSVDVTAYLRDIRNLTGTRADEIIIFGGSAKYSKYVNSDFGFVKGIVLTVNKRFGGGMTATLDYTYQVAKGSASDPQEARNAVAGGSLPEVQLNPLSWDQRHTLNVTASYAAPQWGVSVIAQYGSGSPYTPRRAADITSLLTNSQLKPAFFNVDLRAYYELLLDPLKLVFFARVFNLFDIRNENSVYDDTGRAGFTADENRVELTNPRQRINTLAEWYRQPRYFSEPRRIELGMNLEF
jgi:outer membrane receptor for ferrienterochelin and colicin